MQHTAAIHTATRIGTTLDRDLPALTPGFHDCCVFGVHRS
jgi:hypothetical protein